jgi:hypothetical protein
MRKISLSGQYQSAFQAPLCSYWQREIQTELWQVQESDWLHSFTRGVWWLFSAMKLFISYGLCKDTFSGSDSTIAWIIISLTGFKGYRGKWSWTVLRYYLRVCLETVRKIAKSYRKYWRVSVIFGTGTCILMFFFSELDVIRNGLVKLLFYTGA